MRSRGAVRVVVAIGLSAAAGPAAAQTAPAPPYDPNVDVQLFQYEVGPKTYFSVDDGAVAAKSQLAVDLMVTFLSNPVTVYNTSPDGTMIADSRTHVVKQMLAGEIGAAYGLTDKYQLGIVLPLVFNESGDGIDVTTAMKGATPLQVSGVGDLGAELKAQLYAQESSRLSGAVGVNVPTRIGSGGGDYLGDKLPDLKLRVAYDWSSGKLSFGANAGILLGATRTIYGSNFGQQLTYGGAGSYGVTDKLSIVGEVFGRVGLHGTSVNTSPMEADGGLRVVATKSMAVVLGGGAGILHGIGSPDVRVFASLGYAPDTRDSDGDGIPNNRDKCPTVPEDKDGFQDDDGCPDDDNDGDMRPDKEDKCPNQAEDLDGYQDDDGCPDPDIDSDGVPDIKDRCPNDKEDGKGKFPDDGCPVDKRDSDSDGIFDDKDQCPDQPEDMDGFEDADGCPDLDNDQDGIPDDQDKCPLCPEDKDGVQDADGCPEDDADHDGIPDGKDKCPLEAETVNSYQDDDGCPDDGGAVVADFDGDRITFKAPITFDKKGLTHAGSVILDQAALLMLQHPEVTTWAVAVSAPKDSDVKSHAAAVLRHLKDRGVPLERLHLLSKSGDDEVVIGVEERKEGDASAPPECPAGLEVHGREKPAGATSTPAPTPEKKEPAKTEKKPKK